MTHDLAQANTDMTVVLTPAGAAATQVHAPARTATTAVRTMVKRPACWPGSFRSESSVTGRWDVGRGRPERLQGRCLCHKPLHAMVTYPTSVGYLDLENLSTRAVRQLGRAYAVDTTHFGPGHQRGDRRTGFRNGPDDEPLVSDVQVVAVGRCPGGWCGVVRDPPTVPFRYRAVRYRAVRRRMGEGDDVRQDDFVPGLIVTLPPEE
jgi:hypothetical protein